MTVTITDTDGASAARSFSVTVSNANESPLLNDPGPILAAEETAGLVVDFNATDDADSEGSGLTYTLSGAGRRQRALHHRRDLRGRQLDRRPGLRARRASGPTATKGGSLR